MGIWKSTSRYEAWLGRQMPLAKADLALKHTRMREGPFPFLRATFYRWLEIWPKLEKALASAPVVLAVGDLHVENFGTWRDAEGRLIWGINDFDEATPVAYTNDLVRLAASVNLAQRDGHLAIGAKRAAEAILGGYCEALEKGGRPVVLAEHHVSLRSMATARLKDPEMYWGKLQRLPTIKGRPPASALKALRRMMPEQEMQMRIVHRVAGLGSLGRPRFVALAEWHGGRIAREAKALAPSHGHIYYQDLLDTAVRCPDPYVRVKGSWIVRRLSPDCSRIELSDLPAACDETRLLHAMGWETANVHLGSRKARAVLRHLAKLRSNWLEAAGTRMAAAVTDDWKAWRKRPAR